MESGLYLFIIWGKSIDKKEIILEDIEKKYIIRDMYEIKWDKNEFVDNFKRFYGSTLPNALQKVELCGTDPFLLILVSDPSPKLEIKILDDVHEVEINTNIYNSKMEYRKWIGIDYGLHGSNSKEETNHDLILLLGKNIQDLEIELPKKWNGSIKKIEAELTGNKEWDSMKQFFDVLNITTNYVVLRNFEDLPDKFLHHDIDILTDNVKNMSQIINENESSIGKAPVIIGNKKILLDFRYQEGHHYDEKWSRDILKRRIMSKNGFYIPCKEDYFYSLLYHAMVHGQIREEYKQKLNELALDLDMNKNTILNFNDFTESKKILDNYMKTKKYQRPTINHRILYKIRHSELFRLVKVSIFLTKTYGIRFLLRKIRIKIQIIKNSK